MGEKRSLHEVIDIIDTMCDMQANGIDSAIPYLRGNPGGGKTESIRAMALENGDCFLSCHFALKQPEDLGGIPQFTTFEYDGKKVLSTKWSIPEILEELIHLSAKAKENKKKVIFFLDDIHRAGPFHVTALFELLSERKIRDTPLPSNVAIVLAGNGSTKAGAQLTNSAIINRCAVYDVVTDFEYWRDHFALKHDINHHVLSFLSNQRFAHLFHEDEDISNPWASPRTWTKFSNLLNNLLSNKKKITIDKMTYIAQAHIGEKAAKEFVAYYQIVSKFKVNELFKSIQKNLKESDLMTTINKTVEDIDNICKEELQFYAISHAAVIEFLQKNDKERKKENYVDNLCVTLLALEKNKNNPFPEMTIGIIKELFTIFKNKNNEKIVSEIMNTFDKMAKEVGMRTIQELTSDLFKATAAAA